MHIRYVAVVLASVAFILAPMTRRDASAETEPFVSSIAGSGRAATNDGTAAQAAFLMPAAVSVEHDGTIYVADSAAQNVRRIRHGRVETVAGTSDAGASGDDRTGGYVDGRVERARFSRPDGIAVANDGTIFVADAGNDCIRRIARGFVTTFAGSRTKGSADGTGTAARFEDIRALAIDGDGNLYVADDGAGVRKISPAAEVTTLKLSSSKKAIVAVAARDAGKHLVLAYADSDAIHVLANGTEQSVAYEDQREPSSSALTVGFADAMAIVNENTLVVADVATNAVRLIRLPSPPYVTDTMTRAIAGGVREGTDVSGGFADGPSASALVSTPLGVAVGPDGSIVVADAGNRRIRRIAHVDVRESVLSDSSNLGFKKDAYNIAIVGNSYAFFNVLWPESMGGEIESGLSIDAGKVRLRRRAAATTFRIDALSPAAEDTLIRNELGDGEVDLIILLANNYEPPDQKSLRALEPFLAAKGTKVLVVFTPQGFETSPLEFWRGGAQAGNDYASLRRRAARAESYVESLGAHSLLLLDAMQREELAPNRRNFFYGADHHLTVFGSEWVGKQILAELERWKPWL